MHGMSPNRVAVPFSAVEQLEAAVRSGGWDGHFTQISKGRFSTE